jgi:hypothetical protein
MRCSNAKIRGLEFDRRSRRIGEAYEIGENSWKDNDRESFDGSYAAHACVMERLFIARRGFKVVADEIYREYQKCLNADTKNKLEERASMYYL